MSLDSLAREALVRPELLSALCAPILINNYLRLSAYSKRDLDAFDDEYPEYMDGDGYEKVLENLKVENKKEQFLVRDIAKYCRIKNQLVSVFDKYMINCRTGENFKSYLRKRKSCYGRWRVYNNARKIKGGLGLFLKLAAEERPRIIEYF